ncbi:MAG: glutathione peroxidase [Phaeodactylibacter sp.]|nr:glutathione peroxidase [Phaeodactylibacter sp.]
MKIAALLLLLAVLGITLVSATKRRGNTASGKAVPKSFHDLTVTGIDGKEIQMKDFKDKFVMCVNVASKCGFTPQYKSLQALYEQYQDKLVIIGFPSNQFLMQEPGSEEEIATFCEINYGVTFPLTEKIKVKGGGQHPVYSWLTQKELNGVADAKVSWNFNKFLISPAGEWLAHFPSKVGPMSEEVVQYLR